MAEIIQFQDILRARRIQREQEHLSRCVEILEQSLRMQLEEFSHAPAREWPLRAGRIRKLSEVLEYTTGLL